MSVPHNSPLPEDPYYSVDPEALARAALAFRATPKHAEAPASINTHLTIDSHACQLTLRDIDETQLLACLHAILAQFPLPLDRSPERAPGSTRGQVAPPAAPASTPDGLRGQYYRAS